MFTASLYGREFSAPDFVVVKAPTTLENSKTSSMHLPSHIATARAPLKESPAAVVSIAFTFILSDNISF